MKKIIRTLLKTQLGKEVLKQLLSAFYLAILAYLQEKAKSPVDQGDPLTQLYSGSYIGVQRFFQVATSPKYQDEFTVRFIESGHLDNV